MTLQQLPYTGPADQAAMAALVRAFPADNLHVTDLPYRFSSWAFDDPRNAARWVDAAGQLAAWAVLQTPFWALDYAYRPDADPAVHHQILAWASDRARSALDTPSGRPSWFANVFTGQAQRRRDLEQAGFACVADIGEDSWSKVLLRRAEPAPAAPALPAGFSLRPLAGADEVSAYVDLHRAVFESTNMTVDWRARTLRHPAYHPELDLVAVAPDGRLAAFCVGWFQAGPLPSGQIEPMGVHSDFRQLGLGRAILSEAVRRLVNLGVAHIDVETDSYRNAAFELYEAVGFRVIQDVLVYRQDYAAAPA